MSTPYYRDDRVTLHHGDCLDVLRTLPDASVDSVVTDPPYGLEFMGKDWDAPWKASSVGRGVRVEAERAAEMTERGKGHTTPGGPFLAARVDSTRVAGKPFQDWCEAWSRECLRVLKPGGHLLAFGGTRTWHRLACAVEDAGFEMRDSIAWLYGSGFSKGGLLGNKAGLEWCECGPNALPYSHAHSADLPRVRQDIHPSAVARSEGQDAVLLTPVQRGSERPGVGQARPQGTGSLVVRGGSVGSGEDAWGAEPGMGGRHVSGARQGLPDGAEAGAPTGQSERLRGGAPVGHGGDDRAPGRAAGGSAPHQPGPGGQPTGELEALPGPHEPLDDGARRGRVGCPRCGGLDPAFRGFSTTLKPAFEPVVVARKPLGGTVASNVLQHGTGALNIDGCRIEASQSDVEQRESRNGTTRHAAHESGYSGGWNGLDRRPGVALGRWPANVALDESHEPVLRLRYNLPTEVERTIRESFGASTDHLPAVRDTRDGAAEQGQASEVLLPQVPGALDVGEPDGRARPEVGQAAHAGNSGADLGDQEGQPPHGREGRELEGRALPQSGVRLREVVDASAERAGDLRADGDPQRRDLHTGAPASRGAATRAGADLRGDRASRERAQGGQPAGEPGTPRVEQLAPDEARRGRRRDVPAATGERTTAGRPLEVLRRECPPGWWRYFDVIGHRREGQAAVLDEQSGITKSGGSGKDANRTAPNGNGRTMGHMLPKVQSDVPPSEGGASRFFYVAKAPATERPRINGTAHPTVKPLDLMRWLVRLVTPPGGTVLEPFAGSGTTVEACIIEGFDCIAIEKGEEYLPLITQRIHRQRNPVEAIRQTGADLGLFELDGEGA